MNDEYKLVTRRTQIGVITELFYNENSLGQNLAVPGAPRSSDLYRYLTELKRLNEEILIKNQELNKLEVILSGENLK